MAARQLSIRPLAFSFADIILQLNKTRRDMGRNAGNGDIWNRFRSTKQLIWPWDMFRSTAREKVLGFAHKNLPRPSTLLPKPGFIKRSTKLQKIKQPSISTAAFSPANSVTRLSCSMEAQLSGKTHRQESNPKAAGI